MPGEPGATGRGDADAHAVGDAALLADGEVLDRAADLAVAVEEADALALEELRLDPAVEAGLERLAVEHPLGDEAGVVHVGAEDPAGRLARAGRAAAR